MYAWPSPRHHHVPPEPPLIDHIVLAVPDLAAAIDDLEANWGVRPALGGKHTGRGTHNALLSLGDGPYLELIAQDPEQSPGASTARFGLEGITMPVLRTWAAKAPGIETRVASSRAAGYDPGDPASMSRALPGGAGVLEWKLTSSGGVAGVIPFLIDWGNTPHPSTTAPSGCTLASFHVEHPDAGTVRAAFAALGLDTDVREGTEPRLVAAINTPKGMRALV